MITTPISSYRLFQKLHPLSLLGQLGTRRVTGCLSVFTGMVSWSIYLEEGKITYASSSEQVFERLEGHLQRLNQKTLAFDSDVYQQMRLMWIPQLKNQSTPAADYKAICWLVEQAHINSTQAALLIEELAKEVLESFLCLKEGNYKFNSEDALSGLPKFCHLDLRVIVEYCQKQLRQKESTKSIVNLPTLKKSEKPQVDKLAKVDNSAISEQHNYKNAVAALQKDLYTVACIDDSQTVLNSIRNCLDEKKFAVVMIKDPLKALMQILRSKPDLILLDVEMPNLDGYELCSLLRRHSAFKNTPIIMVTGRTGFIDKAKAKIVRSSGYLTKPFTRSELLKLVFKHIQ
ncbi:MAG TPA: response regulator [Nostocaceae cyanobacterium]|nr:response regulator [Nostocaceae cyanobacterium]